MIRNLYMHKQLSRLNPLRCSDGNKRFSMCLSSTCIGANDSHTVLTKNSFGATSKESPKASLDDYLNMYRMVSPGSEMQVWIPSPHKVHCTWLQEHKQCPQSYHDKGQEQKNSRWTIMHRWNSKLLGGSSIIESLEQDTTRTSPFSQLFVERKVQGQKWLWSMVYWTTYIKGGIFGGGLWLQRSTARAIANLVSRSCFACILVQHFAQYA